MALEVPKLREIVKKQAKNPIFTDISAILLVEKLQEIHPAIRNMRVISLRSLTIHFSMIIQKNVLKLRQYGKKHAKISPKLRKCSSNES